MAKSVKQARQFVVHKKVLIHGKAVAVPSYIVPIAAESHLSLKLKKQKEVLT